MVQDGAVSQQAIVVGQQYAGQPSWQPTVNVGGAGSLAANSGFCLVATSQMLRNSTGSLWF